MKNNLWEKASFGINLGLHLISLFEVLSEGMKFKKSFVRKQCNFLSI